MFRDIMDEVDENGDGFISHEEFNDAFTNILN